MQSLPKVDEKAKTPRPVRRHGWSICIAVMLFRAIPSPAIASEAGKSPASSSVASVDPTQLATAPSPEETSRPSISPPKALSTLVVYPEGARGNSLVTLELTVGTKGEVLSATVVTGDLVFGEAAEAQALTWSFLPAMRGSTPVVAKIRFQVTFTQRPPDSEPLDQKPSSSPAQNGLEVTVRGSRSSGDASSYSRAEVRALPGAFGDPFRAVESSPGVTPVASGLPFFFIRGAPPGNVGYFIDDIPVPLLFHAFLGPQVVHPALISKVNLYRGSPPARLGRFAGAIVSSETADSSEKAGGEALIRLLDAGALAQGPFAHGRGSALLGGRYSYTGLLASLLTDATIAYWDYQSRLDYRISHQHTVGVFGFGAYDYFATTSNDGEREFVGTEFHRIDLRDNWQHQKGELVTSATLGIDRSRTSLGVLVDRVGRAKSVYRTELTELIGLEIGGEATVDSYEILLDRQASNYDDLAALFPERIDTSYAIFTDLSWREGRVRIVPGLRLDLYQSLGRFALGVDPRIYADFTITDKFSLFQSLGLLHQPPSFLPSVPAARIAGLRGGLQSSLQHSFGARYALPWRMDGALTGFQSAYFDLNDPLGTVGQADADEASRDTRALGRTVGVELELRRPVTERLTGQVAYTLSQTTRSQRSAQGVAAFDRTHVVNVALGYRLGSGYLLSGRGVFYSGVPTRRLTEDGPRYDSRDRAPIFTRLDLRAEKRWTLDGSRSLGVHFEVLNATMSREVIRRECGPRSCNEETAGPFTLPNVGIDAVF